MISVKLVRALGPADLLSTLLGVRELSVRSRSLLHPKSCHQLKEHVLHLLPHLFILYDVV